MANIQIDGT
jgi:hypothetical protein